MIERDKQAIQSRRDEGVNMLSLANDNLVVSVLDPVADQVRLGSRYCTGGYAYDVTDRRLGPITSGPGYPDEAYPPIFDGQGLPEAFHSFYYPGCEGAALNTLPPTGTPMLVIGVGIVPSPASRDVRQMPVGEFCQWQVSQTATDLVMKTSQSFGEWALTLTRTLRLVNRTLISETRLENTGAAPIHFRWFPHPFFPNPKGPDSTGECCKFNVPVSFPENIGYELKESGFITLKLDHEWDRAGHFQALTVGSGDKLVTTQRHPKTGLIVATCSYAPSFLPIWGNRHTFSFEPYTEQTVAPKASSTWSIVYDF